jgi:hypothetical protein
VRALVLILMVTHKVLMQARHPCVEAMDDMSFIPNDVVLKRTSSNSVITNIGDVYKKVLKRPVAKDGPINSDNLE